jgi:hypothetical protein
MASAVEAIIQQVKFLPLEEPVQVAERIDRLTWAERWRRVCQRIEKSGGPSEAEIDELVRQVRREKPLSERSSTHPS